MSMGQVPNRVGENPEVKGVALEIPMPDHRDPSPERSNSQGRNPNSHMGIARQKATPEPPEPNT